MHRVRRWLDRVRALVDAAHPLGRAARRELPSLTGLHPVQIEWALTNAFETDANDEELRRLVERVAEAPAAHVSLSANVFVGALRAIAVALASSEIVSVRASRREPLTLTLLHHAAPEAFSLVTALRPAPGDHVWAYGADDTLAHLRASFPKGVVLHGHGNGFGVLVVDEPTGLTLADFDAMALDIAAFDQRGCLSPRFVLLEAEHDEGSKFARLLLEALTRAAKLLPFGTIDPETVAETARHRETWRYLGEVHSGPGGMVSLDLDGKPWGKPPSQRTVHIRLTNDALADLVGMLDAITAVGSRNDPSLAARIQSTCRHARWSPFGFMQRPRLDGPVDLRPDPRGCVI
jgi:hypothetical protein